MGNFVENLNLGNHFRPPLLSERAKCDLKMWLIFLNELNGASIIPDQMWHEDSDLQPYTDASGEIGVAGYFQGRWFQERWPESCSGSNKNSIAWMEFFPIVVAVVLGGGVVEREAYSP